jgi:hypothetical protein
LVIAITLYKLTWPATDGATMATNKKNEREKMLKSMREQPALLTDYDLEEIADNLESRHPLVTLLSTLKMSGFDLVDLALDGTVKDAQRFAQLADEGPNLVTLLRQTGILVELARDRLRAALELRDDHKELFDYSATQLKKGMS